MGELYQQLIDQNPNEIDPLMWDLPFQFTNMNFIQAQTRSMKVVSLTKDPKEKINAIIFAAACSYFRAK